MPCIGQTLYYDVDFRYFNDHNIILEKVELKNGVKEWKRGGSMHIELEDSTGRLLSQFTQKGPIDKVLAKIEEDEEIAMDSGIQFTVQVPTECDRIILIEAGIKHFFNLTYYK